MTEAFQPTVQNYSQREQHQYLRVKQIAISEQSCEIGKHRTHVCRYCEHYEKSYPQQLSLSFQISNYSKIRHCNDTNKEQKKYQFCPDHMWHGNGQEL